MGRILAIDYGLKRVGIAVTDPMQIIASPLTTIAEKEIFAFLAQYFLDEEVESIVVGMPKTTTNKDTDATIPVIKFIKKLRVSFPSMPLIEIDERFTSKIATQAILQSGAKKKQRRDKKLVDKVSASLILQTHLESQS